jgi:hypothetical protein
LLWHAYDFDNVFAASSITAATFAGSSSMDMWQVGRVVANAPIFFGHGYSMAGGSIRSRVEISAQVGLVFHLYQRHER